MVLDRDILRTLFYSQEHIPGPDHDPTMEGFGSLV